MMANMDIDTHMINSLKERNESLQIANDDLRGNIEQLKEEKDLSDSDNDMLRKKLASAQQEIDMHNSNQERMESLICALEKDTEQVRSNSRQLTKEKKDAELRLEKEIEEYEADRLRWSDREADLIQQARSHQEQRETAVAAVKRMSKDISQQKLATPRKNMHSAADRKEESTDQVRQSKSQSKGMERLSEQVALQKIAMDKQVTKMKDQDQQIRQLEKELSSVQKLNRTLMEENESYQNLLHEKTLSGNFTVDLFADRTPSKFGDKCAPTIQPNRKQKIANHGLNLEAELKQASQKDSASRSQKSVESLEDEIKLLQDANRALQLYMNKILMRIVDNKQLEDVLSIDEPTSGIQPQVSASTMLPKTQALMKDEPAPMPTRTFSSTLLGRTKHDDNRRRTLSSWAMTDQNTPQIEDRRSSMATSGTWAKAFRRMSGIGAGRPAANLTIEPQTPTLEETA